ncbi:MAG: class I SAM-dependent methyltransferase [Haloarculaceae archaeon]
MRRFSADYLERTRAGLWAGDRAALADLRLGEVDSVLDVGCGTGEFTRVLAAECPGRVIGCDRDPELLAHLRGGGDGDGGEDGTADADGPDAGDDRGRIHAVRGDALTLPLPEDSVDVVACQALLVNLPDPERAVREFARVARERVAVVEPDNARVRVDSTVEEEPPLARRARELYLAGVGTDAALGDASDLFRSAGLADVRVRRHDHERTVEPPYSEAELAAVGRKARGDALRDRRAELRRALDADGLDEFRSDWRAMGRTVVEQVRAGDYRRRETIPFFVTVGEVRG